MQYDKKKFYEKLYEALCPKLIVVYATTSGYRELDDGFCDYDLLIAVDPTINSKTWIQISNMDSLPHIFIKINGSYINYDLGAENDNVVDENPSINSGDEDDKRWLKEMMNVIGNTFKACESI